jgi:tetratricopeptide (TPR) repeat protein/predicted Ser/Thr protein kinase
MIGKTISHYKILEKLGEGGMGVVYKAEDSDLKRTVALKFLSPQALAGDEDKARFVHEAQAAAALNHPNICTVYEIGKFEGDSFIAMECIEGESLKKTISSGPMKLDEAIDITTQICNGLQKAHEKEIVHRDIKPGNVMVTPEGQVKIMDFGLAKSSEQTKLTRTGTTVGTAAYMSPEQTRGDEVDHRTDIWSLGAILYEMVTGKVPFGGEFEQAVLYSILNEEPRPIASFRSSAPGGLQRIIDKALEKDAGERYQSADELLADLSRLQEGKGASAIGMRSEGMSTRRKTLYAGIGVVVVIAAAILLSPYVAPPGIISRLKGESTRDAPPVPGAGQQEDFFVVVAAPFWGQSEEALAEGDVMRALIERRLIDELGSEENVRILGESLTDAPRSHDEARALGKELDASVVLWGEILILRDEVEIQPYMTLVGLDFRQLRDRAASALQANLQDPNQLAMRKSKAEELGNMALVVAAIYYEEHDSDKALSVLRRISPPTSESIVWQGNVYLYQDDFDEATRLYMQALELDPNDAWARSGMGHVHCDQGDFEAAIEQYQMACDLAPKLAYSRFMLGRAYDLQGNLEAAGTEYEKSIELDPDYDVAYNSMGTVYVRQQRMDEAVRYYKKALELDPTYGEAHINIAWVYAWQGTFELAVDHAQRAVVGAYSDWTAGYSGLGVIYHMSGKYEEAAAAFRKALELDPERAATHRRLGEAYLQTDEVDSALVVLTRAVELDPESALCQWYLSIAHAQKGQHDEAVAAIATAIQLDPTEPYSNLFYFISLHRAGRVTEARAHIGEFSKTLEDTAWVAPVVRFYAGEITEEEVLEQTDDPDPRKAQGQLCEAFYYLGMAQLLTLVPQYSSADTVKAIKYLEKCVATDMTAYTEHGCAKRELDRLTR